MKEVLIVYNPNSGVGVSDEVLKEYKNKLKSNGYKYDFVTTEGVNHARKIVMNAKEYDLVLSMGGDGTLNEVVNGNISRDKKMTICPLPTGSCNDVASMFGYSKNLIANLDLALNGEVKEIDIGTINDRAFTYVVGVGKFMNISYETPRDIKTKLGYLAYLKEGFKELFDSTKTYKAKVVLDDLELDGEYSLIMISNSNHIAGIPEVYKDMKVDDGMLEVLLCKSNNIADMIYNIGNFYLGGKPKNITTLKAKDIKVTLLEETKDNWCIDGEKLEPKKYHYHIKNTKKMNFQIPKGNDKLFIK